YYRHGHESGLSKRSEPVLSAGPDRFRSLSSYANGRPGCRSGPQGTGPPRSRAKGSLWALRGNEWTRSQEPGQQRSAPAIATLNADGLSACATCYRTSSPMKIKRPCAGGASGPSSIGSTLFASWQRAFDHIGGALSPSSKLDSPMARSRWLTVCSNLLSVWPEDSAPCVASA